MNSSILKKLGLSQDESDIYLHLLQHPKQLLNDLSIQLNINRPKLYKILPAMIESGLISKIIVGKRIKYIAENPKMLRNYLETIQDDFDTFIPEIEKVYSNSFDKPILKHLSGRSGIRNIFLDIANSLEVGGVFYRYSSRKEVGVTSISDKEYSKYKKIRNQKELQRYVITNEYLNNLKGNKLDKEIVVIPAKIDIFEDNITKIIYADKVAIIDYNTDECFIIQSKIFAHFEKKLFMMLFKFLR